MKARRYGLWIFAGTVLAGAVIVGLLWYRSSLIQQGIDRNRVTARQAQATARQARAAAKRAELAVTALCLQEADLGARIRHDQRQLDRSTKFFRDHPDAFPNVPRALIAQGFADDRAALRFQRTTRRNLRILHCKAAP